MTLDENLTARAKRIDDNYTAETAPIADALPATLGMLYTRFHETHSVRSITYKLAMMQDRGEVKVCGYFAGHEMFNNV